MRGLFVSTGCDRHDCQVQALVGWPIVNSLVSLFFPSYLLRILSVPWIAGVALRVGDREYDFISVGIADNEHVHPASHHDIFRHTSPGEYAGTVGLQVLDPKIQALLPDLGLLPC